MHPRYTAPERPEDLPTADSPVTTEGKGVVKAGWELIRRINELSRTPSTWFLDDCKSHLNNLEGHLEDMFLSPEERFEGRKLVHPPHSYYQPTIAFDGQSFVSSRLPSPGESSLLIWVSECTQFRKDIFAEWLGKLTLGLSEDSHREALDYEHDLEELGNTCKRLSVVHWCDANPETWANSNGPQNLLPGYEYSSPQLICGAWEVYHFLYDKINKFKKDTVHAEKRRQAAKRALTFYMDIVLTGQGLFETVVLYFSYSIWIYVHAV
ncbi:hypothetical protein T439DRAFT_380333 [Meredithblackwellia eburnea MCA 4105]